MMVDMTMRQEKYADIKHVFFGGGFPGNDLTRHVLTREITARMALKQLMGTVSLVGLH